MQLPAQPSNSTGSAKSLIEPAAQPRGRFAAVLDRVAAVCTDNLNAGVAVMKSAKDGV